MGLITKDFPYFYMSYIQTCYHNGDAKRTSPTKGLMSRTMVLHKSFESFYTFITVICKKLREMHDKVLRPLKTRLNRNSYFFVFSSELNALNAFSAQASFCRQISVPSGSTCRPRRRRRYCLSSVLLICVCGDVSHAACKPAWAVYAGKVSPQHTMGYFWNLVGFPKAGMF